MVVAVMARAAVVKYTKIEYKESNKKTYKRREDLHLSRHSLTYYKDKLKRLINLIFIFWTARNSRSTQREAVNS